jgi:hypothetical protein
MVIVGAIVVVCILPSSTPNCTVWQIALAWYSVPTVYQRIKKRMIIAMLEVKLAFITGVVARRAESVLALRRFAQEDAHLGLADGQIEEESVSAF